MRRPYDRSVRQPRWMRELVVGAVIAERNGAWRVVRRVHRKPNGDLWGVTLTIRRCSWTGRCYTVICASDMKTRGFRLIPVKPRRLRSAFDKKIAAATQQGGRPTGVPRNEFYILNCCDVEGVA